MYYNNDKKLAMKTLLALARTNDDGERKTMFFLGNELLETSSTTTGVLLMNGLGAGKDKPFPS